jgi:small-conductance mechanosensitive channel
MSDDDHDLLRQQRLGARSEPHGCGLIIFAAIVGAIVGVFVGAFVGGIIGAIGGSENNMGLWTVIDDVVIYGRRFSGSWANHRDYIKKGAMSGLIKGAIIGAIVLAILGVFGVLQERGDGASKDK